jgi:hypothetical protein
MNSPEYKFSSDNESILFFDIIIFAIINYCEYNYDEALNSINRFYDNNPDLWEDYWYEHEGYSQIISGILFEDRGEGKYRDSNFCEFATNILLEYVDMFSSLGMRRMKLMRHLDSYPFSGTIESRLDCIEKCLEPFWNIF